MNQYQEIGVFTLIFVVFSCCNCARDSNQIFRTVFGEFPESVIVINSQDQLPFDCCIWVHFLIDKADFDRLFKDYHRQDVKYQKWKSVLPPEVDWWIPESFASAGLYYEKVSEGGRMTEGVYTNAERNEAFYVNSYH
ncbi:MAG: hypothetical protein AAFR36_30940 [Bacteroidota bacterium]